MLFLGNHTTQYHYVSKANLCNHYILALRDKYVYDKIPNTLTYFGNLSLQRSVTVFHSTLPLRARIYQNSYGREKLMGLETLGGMCLW